MSAYVFDATANNFEQDVLLASRSTPMLVDFWAPWCGPCRQLSPMLDKIATEYGGAIQVAKVNTDDEMQLAAMFGIRSLPTVVLIRDGQPVDGFMGAQPEGAIRALLARHGIEPATAAAQVHEDVAHYAGLALDELQMAFDRDPENLDLRFELASALIQAGQTPHARALVEALSAEQANDPRKARVLAWADLSDARVAAGDPAGLAARLASDPSDHAARDGVALDLLLQGHHEAALEHFVELLKRDRNWNEGLARKRLIAIFAAIDDEDLVGRYRRRMASVLF